jgi:hypothetical protein
MSRATLDALSQATEPRKRERLAWLLKTVLAREHQSEAIDWILDPAAEAPIRIWILEAIERLAFGRSVGWDQLGGVVATLGKSTDPAFRMALASILMALPWRSSNVEILEPLLNDADPDIVAAAARTLAGHPGDVRRLHPQIIEQLRRHRDPRIRHCAAELTALL